MEDKFILYRCGVTYGEVFHRRPRELKGWAAVELQILRAHPLSHLSLYLLTRLPHSLYVSHVKDTFRAFGFQILPFFFFFFFFFFSVIAVLSSLLLRSPFKETT